MNMRQIAVASKAKTDKRDYSHTLCNSRIHSEKCHIRQNHYYENVTACTYPVSPIKPTIHQGYTIYNITYLSETANLYSTLLY